MRYRRGTSRHQQSFLSLDDLISNSNVIRVVDVVCEEFYKTVAQEVSLEKGNKETGRMAYHPSDMLKILVYGYFNGISSSRKLERESVRNVEMKWLTGDLAPDHKTISDFRKDNGDMIRGLFGHLITHFKAQGLLTGKSIAIDGSKIKANASQEINIDTIRQKLEGIEIQAEKYLKEMEAIDNAEDEVEELMKKKAELEAELEKLAGKKKSYESSIAQLEELGEKRISTTDAESKMMRGRYGKYWGYNMQVAVDTQHHLITTIKVTNNQNDKGLLTPMVEASAETTGQKAEELSADAGYYKISQIEALEKEGTHCYVAINKTASQVKDEDQGLQFTYHQQEDRYYCGEGKKLDYWRKKKIDGRKVRVYKGIECTGCLKKDRCTTAEGRNIHRNENQEWIDAFHAKMNTEKGKSRLVKRRSVVEHPFGTMKYYMGQIPVLLRGKKKAQIEMNLYAIGYNLKRYFNIQTQLRREQQIIELKLAA
jgi:transposase